MLIVQHRPENADDPGGTMDATASAQTQTNIGAGASRDRFLGCLLAAPRVMHSARPWNSRVARRSSSPSGRTASPTTLRCMVASAASKDRGRQAGHHERDGTLRGMAGHQVARAVLGARLVPVLRGMQAFPCVSRNRSTGHRTRGHGLLRHHPGSSSLPGGRRADGAVGRIHRPVHHGRQRGKPAHRQSRRSRLQSGGTVRSRGLHRIAPPSIKGPDDLRALLLGPFSRVARGSGPPCCGCRAPTAPEIGHIPTQPTVADLRGDRADVRVGNARHRPLRTMAARCGQDRKRLK